MLVVFTSAKLMSEILERLKQPGIVGEILAGVVIGPSVLGWVAPGAFLSALADLGAMFLLFRVGLEVKSSELLKVSGTAAIVAVSGVISTFGLVWAVLTSWGSPSAETLFIAAALVATSVGITAQVLSGQNLLQLTASKVILAAAVIDDVLGLIVVAVVTSVAAGKWNLGELLTTAGLALGFTIAVAVWGPKAVGAMVPRVQERLRASEGQFILALILMFLCSALAVYSGIAAIVGAFLAGMALAEHTSPRERDLAQGVSAFLVPFFLAMIGVNVNLSVFSRLSTVILTIALVLTVVLSKVVGCGLGALSLGRVDAVRIGVGMIPRGEVCVAVARLGLALGIIRQNMYSVVVLAAVAAAALAPPLLHRVFRNVPSPAGTETYVFRLG
ncbi:MAG TPA: cation:proton antiporter, partial [Candidatus Sulfotelmatobacter sp.]|nr:cation:proton antiporter [Candidatus Sulfotelmatobacter sp.]